MPATASKWWRLLPKASFAKPQCSLGYYLSRLQRFGHPGEKQGQLTFKEQQELAGADASPGGNEMTENLPMIMNLELRRRNALGACDPRV